MAAVRSLGYAIIDSTDLDAWETFLSDVIGMQLATKTSDRLEFRMDEKAYRFVINRADRDGLDRVGWEASGPAGLEELAAALEHAGHAVTRHSREEAAARQLSGLVSFPDPEGMLTIELFTGLADTTERFVSPTGATFKVGVNGIGHLNQGVEDVEAYRSLYFDILGFKLSDQIAYANGRTSTFLHCNPRHHSYGFANATADRPAGIGHLMVEVTELNVVGRAWDKVQAGAAPILSTLGEHTNDRMVSFYVKSPSGFGFEFGTGAREIDDATWTPGRHTEAHTWGHLPMSVVREQVAKSA